MLRSVLLILAGFLLCLLCGVLQHPLTAGPVSVADTTDHPQMDASPAVSGNTASQLQSASLLSQRSGDLTLVAVSRTVPGSPAAALSLCQSLHSSILLRI